MVVFPLIERTEVLLRAHNIGHRNPGIDVSQ
jgi:hypothetical protein